MSKHRTSLHRATDSRVTDEDFDADSVAAVIFTTDSRYLLQQRADLPQVTFPSMWGLFGGARDTGELPELALRRELVEELAFVPTTLDLFLVSTYDLRAQGGWFCRRAFYSARIDASEIGDFVLGEGDALKLFNIQELSSLADRVVPFDLSALALHDRYHA